MITILTIIIATKMYNNVIIYKSKSTSDNSRFKDEISNMTKFTKLKERGF